MALLDVALLEVCVLFIWVAKGRFLTFSAVLQVLLVVAGLLVEEVAAAHRPGSRRAAPDWLCNRQRRVLRRQRPG